MPLPPNWTRVTFDLPCELDEELKDATMADGVSRSARMLALVQAWSEDPRLAKKVARRGTENRLQALRERGRS